MELGLVLVIAPLHFQRTEMRVLTAESAWSACLDCRAEDVRIQALEISGLKFIDIQMQIFLAHLVEHADNAAFHDGPKAFDGVGMQGWLPVILNCARPTTAT